MAKSRITYRIIPELFTNESKYQELRNALKEQRKSYDDLALFNSFTHSVLSLDESAKRFRIMERRSREFRAAELGDKVGFNILCTIGHHAENLPLSPREFTPLTDLEGFSAPGTCCPNDPDYQEKYLKPFFTAAAEAKPDFIWLDDDIRTCGHGSASVVCFCAHCMELFNQKHGYSLTREELCLKLDTGSEEEKIGWRRKVQTFSGETIVTLFRNVERIVHAVNPLLELGAMDGAMHPADNSPYEKASEALRGESGAAPLPRWRPGGGAYTDRQMLNEMVLGKAVMIGCECAILPESLTDVEAEIESFNYQRLRKSRHATKFEAALYCAAGATGTAWNILDGGDEFRFNLPVMRAAAEIRPFLDKLVSVNGRIRPKGVYNGWVRDYGVLNNLNSGKWNRMNGWDRNPFFNEFFAGGIPPAYTAGDAQLSILIGETVKLYSDAELLKIFASGVYCDVSTVNELIRRGLGELAGFRPGKIIPADASEYLSDHPLNGCAAGSCRDCRQSFAPWFGSEGPVCELEPLNPDCETLASLKDYQGNRLADCSLGICTNSLGGRVAVSGYYPLRDMLFAGKLMQMKNLFRHLSGNTLTAYVGSYHCAALWVREEGARRTVEVANASLDPAENIELIVKTDSASAELTDMECHESRITGEVLADGYVRFRVPFIQPWSMVLVDAKPE